MFGDPKRKERKIEKEASEGAGKKMNGKEEEKAARALKEWEATAVETKKEAEEALEAEKRENRFRKERRKKNQKGRIKERRKNLDSSRIRYSEKGGSFGRK